MYLKKIHAMDNLDKLDFEATLTNKKLKDICKELKAANIKVTEVEEGDMDVDALIQLSNKYHIQVGHGYLIFSKSDGEGDDFGTIQIAEAKNIKDLLPKIKKEMKTVEGSTHVIAKAQIKWKDDEWEQKKLFHRMIGTLNSLESNIKEVYSAMLALKENSQPWKQYVIESPKWTTQYGPDRNINDMVTNTLNAAKQLDKVWKKVQSDNK